MSLKNTLQQMTKQAFEVLASVMEEVTYVSVGSVGYDVISGTVDNSGNVEYVLRASLSSYKDAEIDFEVVQLKDKRCVIQVRELPADPKLVDKLRTTEGEWDIINIKRPFGSSVYTLQLRKPV